MIKSVVLPCAVGCGFSLLCTPLVRRLALHWGVVDAPDGFRKLHGRTVALGGGVAIALACAMTFISAAIVGAGWVKQLGNFPTVAIGVAVGAVLICFIGLLDDRFHLRGRQKLLGQVAVSLLAISSGLVIEHIGMFGWEIELGLLAVPLTLCWLLGAINSLNLIDGMDGLATSVGVILCGTICALSVLHGHPGEASVAAILAGALLGFLPYNWRPAKMFLGDAGSMFIGFLLGVLAIRATLKGPATVALIAPTAIWAIPFLDVGVAILRRKLTGQSLYATDRGHLHHVLQRSGHSQARTVMIIGGLCGVCCLGALLSVLWKNELAAIVAVGSVAATLIATRSFGYPEFCLLGQRVLGLFTSFFRLPQGVNGRHQLCSRFHGSREFREAWSTLIDFAERFGLSSLNLNINAPMLGEVYHAHWHRTGDDSERFRWETRLPLIWHSHEIGSLAVYGPVPAGMSPFTWSSELMEALRPFELEVLDLLSDGDTAGAVSADSLADTQEIETGLTSVPLVSPESSGDDLTSRRLQSRRTVVAIANDGDEVESCP